MQNSPATQTATGKIVGSLSPSKLPRYLLVAIFFLSSTQLGLHFWPASSLVYGIRIDYLAPTLYFLDILIIIYLLIRKLENFPCLRRQGFWDLRIVLPPLLVNLLYSANPLATLSWSLHLLLYSTFLFSVLSPQPVLVTKGPDLLRRSWPASKMFSRASKTNSETRSDALGELLIKTLRVTLTLSLLFQATLSTIQVYLGHSVGGLLYYLGERSVAVGSPGIALGSYMGEVVLRAYGTFGHPNVLAGWAVIVLLILIQISETTTPAVGKQRAVSGSDPLRRSLPFFTHHIPYSLFSVLLVLLFTQSHTALLSLLAIIIPFYLIKLPKLRLLYFSIALCSLFIVLLQFPPRPGPSLTERATLQQLSLSVIQAFPIFGTGAQASISTYPTISPESRLFQPDHNSFTLFLSWFGIFGLIATLYILRFKFENLTCLRRQGIWDLRIVAPLLPLLLFDHYLLTSPQGLFVLLLYISLRRLMSSSPR